MGNTFTWPILLSVKRLFMALTIGCVIYTIYFFLINFRNPVLIDDGSAVIENAVTVETEGLALDLKPYESTAAVIEARDIFSSSVANETSASGEDAAPTGQLPSNFKVVGILIAHPSQVIIEDTSARQTYFINEDKPQAGIKIVTVKEDQIILNFQGQDISVPLNKTINKITVDHAPTP